MGENKYYSSADIDARREWIRKHLPSGREGYVYEDIDLVIRRFTRSDPMGRFRLVEFKWNGSPVGIAQEKTFGLINRALLTSDLSNRYGGFWVVRWPGISSGKCGFCQRDYPAEIDPTGRPSVKRIDDSGAPEVIDWEDLRDFISWQGAYE